MNAPTVESILEELHADDAKVLKLLAYYRPDQNPAFRVLWREDTRLACAFARAMLSEGHPAQALELVARALDYHKDHPELLYLSALALARSRSISRAEEKAKEVLQNNNLDTSLRIEALSLLGRLNKDRYERLLTGDDEQRKKWARQAYTHYEQAYQLTQDSFPGINAATMAMLAGDPARSRKLAEQVLDQATARLEAPEQEEKDRHWLLAVLGEANLLLDDPLAAKGWYRQAIRKAGRRVGDIAVMCKQVRLLRGQLPIGDDLLELFHVGRVVLFAGHAIDDPEAVARGEAVWRFPADGRLEKEVARIIRRELELLNATIGYCSPGSGSEILFGELMRQRASELHLVLPFAQDDFYRTRVDYGRTDLAGWRQRCDALLARRESVHFATTEDYLDDEELFDFAGTFLQGMGIARAQELGVEPIALVVVDPATQLPGTGIDTFIRKWEAGGRKPRTINLAEIRARLGLTAPVAVAANHRSSPARYAHRRAVQAMLFADVKGYSKLPERQAPEFFLSFLNLVKDQLDKAAVPPLFSNTWGDGLYIVFPGVTACAEFALHLLRELGEVKWHKLGLPKDTGVRIGMHTGPVFKGLDPIINRENYFGSHVSRAARIEPVTTPGCAFVSEQFMALLAMEAGHPFVCEYIGVQELAKEYDRCPLYCLAERGGDGSPKERNESVVQNPQPTDTPTSTS